MKNTCEDCGAYIKQERVSAICARWFEEHKVFRRSFVLVFFYIFIDMNFWLQRMIESKIIEGGYFVEVYVGAMVGGIVSIVVGYASSGNKSKE